MDNALSFVTPELLSVIGTLIVFAVGFFKVKDRIKGKKYEKALLIMSDATMKTYGDFVQDLKAKKAAKGEKLTVAEKKEAMDRTLATARDNAMSMGINLLKALGTAYLPGVVENIIKHKKAA